MVSDFYQHLTSDQVTAAYFLITFLRRLRVMGHLELSTVETLPEVIGIGQYDLLDMTNAIYGIAKYSYNPDKGTMDAMELLESMFGRLSTPLRGI